MCDMIVSSEVTFSHHRHCPDSPSIKGKLYGKKIELPQSLECHCMTLAKRWCHLVRDVTCNVPVGGGGFLWWAVSWQRGMDPRNWGFPRSWWKNESPMPFPQYELCSASYWAGEKGGKGSPLTIKEAMLGIVRPAWKKIHVGQGLEVEGQLGDIEWKS